MIPAANGAGHGTNSEDHGEKKQRKARQQSEVVIGNLTLPSGIKGTPDPGKSRSHRKHKDLCPRKVDTQRRAACRTVMHGRQPATERRAPNTRRFLYSQSQT